VTSRRTLIVLALLVLALLVPVTMALVDALTFGIATYMPEYRKPNPVPWLVLWVGLLMSLSALLSAAVLVGRRK
jgi:ABC-type sulfate transport system permease subunit